MCVCEVLWCESRNEKRVVVCNQQTLTRDTYRRVLKSFPRQKPGNVVIVSLGFSLVFFVLSVAIDF